MLLSTKVRLILETLWYSVGLQQYNSTLDPSWCFFCLFICQGYSTAIAGTSDSGIVNSLRPSDAIRRHGTWSASVQVMT